jgi:hypothetical protein
MEPEVSRTIDRTFTFNVDGIECFIRRNFSIDNSGVVVGHSK